MADEATVAADTDDLDAFEQLLFGNAKEEEGAAPDKGTEGEDDQVDAPEDEDTVEAPEKEAEDEEKDDDPAPRKKQTAQERIIELTAARKAAERLAELEKTRAAELEDRIRKLEEGNKPDNKVDTTLKSPEPDALGEDGEPIYPLGEFDPKYIRDLTKFTIAQEREEDRRLTSQQQAQQQAVEAKNTLLNEWETKLSKAEETLPDVRAKARNLEEAFTGIDPDYGEYLAATIMSMDKGPEVLHYLSDNVEEAKRIANMGAVRATVELGRIEAQVGTKARVVKTSEAPPPPPRNRGGSVTTSVAPDTDDLEAFEKAFFSKRKY